MSQRAKNISIDAYIDLQIEGYREIIYKSQGAIEALFKMKQSLMKKGDYGQAQEEAEAPVGNPAGNSYADPAEASSGE